MNDDIEYRYVRGQGWVAGYIDQQPISLEGFEKIIASYLRAGVITTTEVARVRFGTVVYNPRAIAYMDGI